MQIPVLNVLLELVEIYKFLLIVDAKMDTLMKIPIPIHVHFAIMKCVVLVLEAIPLVTFHVMKVVPLVQQQVTA